MRKTPSCSNINEVIYGQSRTFALQNCFIFRLAPSAAAAAQRHAKKEREKEADKEPETQGEERPPPPLYGICVLRDELIEELPCFLQGDTRSK